MYKLNNKIKRFIKKIFSIEMSELVVIVVFAPFLLAILNNQNINIGVTVPPPQDPKITTVIAYPNLKAPSIGIAGKTIYNTQLIWLEDQVTGQAIELITDTDGYFVATLDESSQFTSVGAHQVIALIEIEQDEVILLKSNVLSYSIDEQFNITLEPFSEGITLLTANITEDSLKGLQDKYQLSILSSNDYAQLKNRWLSFEQMFFWFTVFEWTIYVIVLLFVPYLLIRRWKRKKAEHKSFWSLGRGVYFQHDLS